MTTTPKVAFLSRALHDLQAPARHVVLFADLLRDSLASIETDEDVSQYVDTIERAGMQMQGLLIALRQFVKLPDELGTAKSVDLAPLVRGCWEEVDGSTEVGASNRAGGAIDVVGNAQAFGSADLLKILCIELLKNASDYRDRDRPLQVRCELNRDDTHTTLKISDNGIGIEPEYTERVLEPFERLPSPGLPSGPGLGLATCSSIVRLHGGEIKLDSDGRQGTTVTVWLPVQT